MSVVNVRVYFHFSLLGRSIGITHFNEKKDIVRVSNSLNLNETRSYVKHIGFE